MTNWYVVFSGLIGALVGGLVTAWMHYWKFRRDEFGARCDELCRALVEAGQVAADYWSQEFEDPQKARAAEARLLGMQALIDGLSVQVLERFRKEDVMRVQRLLSDLMDALTGGQFSEASRPIDLARTSRAPQIAGGLVAKIREAHRNTMLF